MKRLAKVLCLIAGVLCLGLFGHEEATAYAEEETHLYTYKGVTYEYISTEDGVVITGKKDDNEKYLEFPQEISGCKVIGINKLPDSNASGIKVPEGYLFIGEGVFSDWFSLESVELPESLTSIGDSAFSGCIRLEKIVLPKSAVYMGDSVFRSCNSLLKVEVPEGVTKIGEYVFYGCNSLQKVDIPEGVISIREYAFYGCNSLQKVNMPEGVTSIGEYAFYECSSLQKVNIPEGVTSIGDFTFYKCWGLEEIKLPESITSIGEDAFLYCDAVIELPSEFTGFSGDEFKSSIFAYERQHLHVISGSAAEKRLKEVGRNKTWDIGRISLVKEPTCTEEGEIKIYCERCELGKKAIPIEHVYPIGKMNQEETCYAISEGETSLKCLVCGHEANHCFIDSEVVGGSKLVAPLIKEGTCDVCGVVGRWNDWNYAWITGIVAVALFGFVVAIINYMRRMKKS